MRSPVIALCLVLAGCGSCFEDKKVQQDQHDEPPRSVGVVVPTDAGTRIIQTGEGRVSPRILLRDASHTD